MFSRTFLSINCRIAGKSSLTVQNVTTHRSLHLACRNLGARLSRCHEVQIQSVLNATFTRNLSVSSTKFQDATISASQSGSVPEVSSEGVSKIADSPIAENLLSQIPEPPTPIVQEVIEAIQTGEPSFASIGIGSWYPSGIVQQALEILHINFDMPWWACIAATTICIRTLMFPIVIRMQRYTARMNNVQPEMQYMQLQLSDARRMNDHMEVMRLTQEMFIFMKEKNIDPKKNAWLPLIQAPVFISFYYGLRGMINVPVESMKEGGLWWFTDLTVPDCYCILPILTSTSLLITLEMGADTLKIGNMGLLKYVFRAVPVVMFPFIIKFEAGVLCYWVSTNMFSLIQCAVLRQPKMREYFKIPALIKHDVSKLPKSKKNFREGFQDSWKNLKVAREIGNREMYDSSVFEKAGRGPIPKTYKFNPLKQQVEMKKN